MLIAVVYPVAPWAEWPQEGDSCVWVHGAPTGASSKLWRLVASLPHALCLGEVLDVRQHLPGHCCVSSQPISLPRLLDYPCSQSDMISMTAD